MINQITEIYARSGKSLINQGIKEGVLPISEVDNFLSILGKSKFIILGGDIYKKTPVNFEHTYENWFYNGQDSEESIIIAKEYLSRFLEDENLFISFILKQTLPIDFNWVSSILKKIIDIDINAEDLIQNGIKFVIINDFIHIKSSELDVFLDFCLKRNFCILGIDGVRIYMNQITHDLNYIVDYSKYMNDCDFCLKSIECSREFLKLIDLKDEYLFFEFTLIQKI